MSNLSFTYSQEFEVERIKTALKRLDWYLDNHYSLNSLSFPVGFDLEKLKQMSDQEIMTVVEAEYDESKFLGSIADLKQTYPKYQPALETLIGEINLTPIPEVKIKLTRYGMGGSYHLPNEIVININRFFSIGLIRNILHEIIHLHIQNLIDQYKISQWDKETVVNLLFEKAFPEIYQEPNIPADTAKAKKIFKENYFFSLIKE